MQNDDKSKWGISIITPAITHPCPPMPSPVAPPVGNLTYDGMGVKLASTTAITNPLPSLVNSFSYEEICYKSKI